MTPIHIKPPRAERDPHDAIPWPCSCDVPALRPIQSQGGDLLALQCPRCGKISAVDKSTQQRRCKGCGSSKRGLHALGCPRKPRGGSSATFSPCGRYRYVLRRRTKHDWSSRTLLWILLNPSTANATEDDPTVRRIVGFTERLVYGEAVIVNLFAAVATDPRELLLNAEIGERSEFPVGPENDRYIRDELRGASGVICAWGAHPARSLILRPGENARTREQEVKALIATVALVAPLCLGLTQDGAPRHPLYVAYEQKPAPWAEYRKGLVP